MIATFLFLTGGEAVGILFGFVAAFVWGLHCGEDKGYDKGVLVGKEDPRPDAEKAEHAHQVLSALYKGDVVLAQALLSRQINGYRPLKTEQEEFTGYHYFQ